MKYCKTCKTRAKDSDTNCATCGKPLSTFGARPASAAGSPGRPAEPALTLQGQIQQLQVTHLRNRRRASILALICGVVFCLLLFVVYQIYDASVLSYAVIQDVKITQDPVHESQIFVSFNVVKPGKVAYDRRSGKSRTEKLDVISAKGLHKMEWAWPSDPATGIDVQLIYRGGLTRETTDAHFAVTGMKSTPLDVVFILDITGSMRPYIDGLKKQCIAFAELVRSQGHDCHLGLFAFGDLDFDRPKWFFSFPLTADVKQFQQNVAGLQLLDGGDEPESSVEALRKALEFEFRPNAKICFIHITDASCHHREQLPSVAAELQRRSITTYVVSQPQWANWYSQLCVHGGSFHPMSEDGKFFEEILLNVARSIANQIKVN